MKQISRRSFLKIFGTGTVAAATATTIGCKNNNEGTRMQDEPAEGKMTYRITPTTKDKVSVLGYGMMRLPTVGQGKAKKGKRQTGDEEIDQNMVNKQIDYALKTMHSSTDSTISTPHQYIAKDSQSVPQA